MLPATLARRRRSRCPPPTACNTCQDAECVSYLNGTGPLKWHRHQEGRVSGTGRSEVPGAHQHGRRHRDGAGRATASRPQTSPGDRADNTAVVLAAPSRIYLTARQRADDASPELDLDDAHAAYGDYVDKLRDTLSLNRPTDRLDSNAISARGWLAWAATLNATVTKQGDRAARGPATLGRPLPAGSRGVPRIPDAIYSCRHRHLGYAGSARPRVGVQRARVLEAAWKNGPDTGLSSGRA